MTGVTGCGMCYPVCRMMHIKNLAANWKEYPMWQRAYSRYVSSPVPYV